eukprot:EG_transcript_4384
MPNEDAVHKWHAYHKGVFRAKRLPLDLCEGCQPALTGRNGAVVPRPLSNVLPDVSSPQGICHLPGLYVSFAFVGAILLWWLVLRLLQKGYRETHARLTQNVTDNFSSPPAFGLFTITSHKEPDAAASLPSGWPLVTAGGDPAEARVWLADHEQTQLLGVCLAQLAQPGDVIALLGDLGAGKTCIARGFVREFFNQPDLHVPSPTYLLCVSYGEDATDDLTQRARLPGTPVYHMDPYRLKSKDQMASLVDFERAFSAGISLIEWPQKLGPALYNDASPGRLEIHLEGVGPQGQGRHATMRAVGSSRWQAALTAWLKCGSMPSPQQPVDEAELTVAVAVAGARPFPAPLTGDPATWKVLGIETSCDDTAAAVVAGAGAVLSNVIASQGHVHLPFRGVKPDAAQAAHQENIEQVVAAALQEAGCAPAELTAVAVTIGPGLSPCLRVGVRKALAFAAEHTLPIIPVHHMEAHALVACLPGSSSDPASEVQFPALILLVSGGHNMLVVTRGVGDHTILGNTLDDSVGEAFDKVARLLGVDAVPGGPALERMAAAGDCTVYASEMPIPLSKGHKKATYSGDFSFAGLKTCVRLLVEGEEQRIRLHFPEEEWAFQVDCMRRDVAACFQHVAIEHLAQVVQRVAAPAIAAAAHSPIRHLVLAGGVAANAALRRRFEGLAAALGLALMCPPLRLCTDNGVMVAWTGLERLRLGLYEPPPPPTQDLGVVDVRPRWPLGHQVPSARAAKRRR